LPGLEKNFDMANTISGNRTLIRDKTFPPVIKLIATICSYVFHPLFIPLYVTGFLLYWHPFVFAGFSPIAKTKLFASVALNLTFFPAITVFLLWRLKFVNSILLRTQKERIIPYAASMIFYFWGWYVFRNFNEIPDLQKQFLLGSFITVIAAWLANIYFKISMHALAMGGMALFMLYIAFSSEGGSGQYASLGLLIAGMVCTARMIVSDHKPVEIYSGLLIGIFCQLIAIWL
jgi:hypothetical protein